MIKPFLELGQIVGTHGIRGEMRVNPSCDSPDFARRFKTLYFDSLGGKSVGVVSCRPHGNIILIKLDGINDIDTAASKKGAVLYFARDDAALPEGTWFIEELKGCRCIDSDDGREYGKIFDVIQNPANDVWCIRDKNGSEYMLPAVKSVIISVDVKNETALISPIKGIFTEPETIRDGQDEN